MLCIWWRGWRYGILLDAYYWRWAYGHEEKTWFASCSLDYEDDVHSIAFNVMAIMFWMGSFPSCQIPFLNLFLPIGPGVNLLPEMIRACDLVSSDPHSQNLQAYCCFSDIDNICAMHEKNT